MKSLKRFWPHLMAFRSCISIILSNYYNFCLLWLCFHDVGRSMHVRMWFETMISWSSIRLICVTLKPPFSDSKWKEQVKTTLPHRTVCANNRLKVYFRFSSSGCNNLTVRVANILSSSQPSLNSTPALPANITSVIHYTPWALALGIGMLHFPHHYQPFWKCK